jgi:hypothetical protein
MECWNREIIAFYAVICQGRKLEAKPVVPIISAAGVYLPEGRHPIIPIFHHSNCERSELSSFFPCEICGLVRDQGVQVLNQWFLMGIKSVQVG